MGQAKLATLALTQLQEGRPPLLPPLFRVFMKAIRAVRMKHFSMRFQLVHRAQLRVPDTRLLLLAAAGSSRPWPGLSPAMLPGNAGFASGLVINNSSVVTRGRCNFPYEP